MMRFRFSGLTPVERLLGDSKTAEHETNSWLTGKCSWPPAATLVIRSDRCHTDGPVVVQDLELRLGAVSGLGSEFQSLGRIRWNNGEVKSKKRATARDSSGSRKVPTVASNCCWCSRWIIWASRVTWSR